MAAEQRSELLAALATLRDDDREVLGARFLLDLSEIETADTLGIPRGTVKSRTSRALTRLRSALGAAGTELER
jgi:RNA polymerase sigma-70 factor (ECF subfamily)